MRCWLAPVFFERAIGAKLGIRVQEYHLVHQLNSLVYAYCHSVHTPTACAAPCADGQGSPTKPYGLFFRVLSNPQVMQNQASSPPVRSIPRKAKLTALGAIVPERRRTDRSVLGWSVGAQLKKKKKSQLGGTLRDSSHRGGRVGSHTAPTATAREPGHWERGGRSRR